MANSAISAEPGQVGPAGPASSTTPLSFVLNNPTSTSLNTPLLQVLYACHITSVSILCIGGTSITGNVNTFDSNGGTSTAIAGDVTASVNTTNNQTGLSVALTAGQFIGWHTTSLSGSPTRVLITVNYTVP